MNIKHVAILIFILFSVGIFGIVFFAYQKSLKMDTQHVKVLSGGARGWPKISWCHGSGAQVGNAVERLLQGVHNSGFVQHVIGTTGSLDGFFLAQHIGITGGHQHHVIKAHDLQGTGSRAHVAGVAGFNQDKSGSHRGHCPSSGRLKMTKNKRDRRIGV